VIHFRPIHQLIHQEYGLICYIPSDRVAQKKYFECLARFWQFLQAGYSFYFSFHVPRSYSL